MKTPTPPFRVGRKLNKVVLDSQGVEIAHFCQGTDGMAQNYCNYLNSLTYNTDNNMELQEIKEHLQENGSDILSIKLLVDRTKMKEIKESKERESSLSRFFILVLIIWTMVLMFYFYKKENAVEVSAVKRIAMNDSISKFKVDSLQDYVDTTFGGFK